MKHHDKCVCGQPTEVPVRVSWKNGPRVYWYCFECAVPILEMDGCEVEMLV